MIKYNIYKRKSGTGMTVGDQPFYNAVGFTEGVRATVCHWEAENYMYWYEKSKEINYEKLM